MILYTAYNKAYLMELIAHKLRYNQDEDALLLMPCLNDLAWEKIYENLAINEIFSDVRLVDMYPNGKMDLDIADYEKYVVAFFDRVFKSIGYRIEDFKNIYCEPDGDDYAGIYLYLNLKHKYYYWLNVHPEWSFEYNCGTESVFFANGYEKWFSLVNKHKAGSCFAQYARPILLDNASEDLKRQIDERIGLENVTFWKKERELDFLDIKWINKVIACFNDNVKLTGEALLIPNSPGYMLLMSKFKYGQGILKKFNMNMGRYHEYLAAMFQVIHDYCLAAEDCMVIKPHPNAPINESVLKKYYGEHFSSVGIIPFEFFARYLALNKIKFDKVIGIASHSNESIKKELYNKKLILGWGYVYTWFFYDSIFVIWNLAFKTRLTIYTDEDIQGQLQCMFENGTMERVEVDTVDYKDVPLIPDNGMLVVNCLLLDSKKVHAIEEMIACVEKDKIVVFLNMDMTDFKLPEYLSGSFLIIEVLKENCSYKKNRCLRNENIYAYCPNKDACKKIVDFYVERKMATQGYILKTRICSDVPLRMQQKDCSGVEAWIQLKLKGKEAKFGVIASDKDALIKKPLWFQEGGEGYLICSRAENMLIEVNIQTSGQLQLFLGGNDGNQTNSPYWIEYTNVKFNEAVLIERPAFAWNDKLLTWRMNANAGEKIILSFSWKPCHTDNIETVQSCQQLIDNCHNVVKQYMPWDKLHFSEFIAVSHFEKKRKYTISRSNDIVLEMGVASVFNKVFIYDGGMHAKLIVGNYTKVAYGVKFLLGWKDRKNLVNFDFSGLFAERMALLTDEDVFADSKIVIGSDVTIGSDAVIYNNISIGNGAVVKDNAVVVKDVPSYAIVAGNPANIIGYRICDSEKRDWIISKMNEIAWWDWSKEEIENALPFLMGESWEEFTYKFVRNIDKR